MDIEKIEKRRDFLIQNQHELAATFNALQGQINECNFWLNEIDKNERELNKEDSHGS